MQLIGVSLIETEIGRLIHSPQDIMQKRVRLTFLNNQTG